MAKKDKRESIPNVSEQTTPPESTVSQILGSVLSLEKEFGQVKTDVSYLKDDVSKLMPSYTKLAERETNRNKSWTVIGKILAVVFPVVIGTIVSIYIARNC